MDQAISLIKDCLRFAKLYYSKHKDAVDENTATAEVQTCSELHFEQVKKELLKQKKHFNDDLVHNKFFKGISKSLKASSTTVQFLRHYQENQPKE